MVTLIEDTRQQANKHENKHRFFEKHGIKYIRSKLPIGDYALLTDLSTIVDTKQSIQEIIGNVTQQHKRFAAECELAKENDIRLCVLIEDMAVTCIDDLYRWYNPRLRFSPRATTGRTLAKILHGMEINHGVKFHFCKPEESGQVILELLGAGNNLLP